LPGSFLQQFAEIKTRYEDQRSRDAAMVCRVGSHLDCDVLKLQNREWTNDDLKTMVNQSGIFFSIWITAAGAQQDRAEYNIHALKLRKLEGYRLTSRDFCQRFRARFIEAKSRWPNVATHYGPLTLMQGWFHIDRKTFAQDVLEMMNRFDRDVAPIIDDLLAPHRIGTQE
jgi:hypothetical protein